MAKLYVTYMNPIPFYKQVATHDLPKWDEMINRTQYYKGIIPQSNYRVDWKISEQIVIQIQTDLPTGTALAIGLVVITPSGYIVIEPTDVTFAAWTGYTILQYSYTPTTEGNYYFYTVTRGPSIDNHFVSQEFYVRANDLDLIEIKYYDTQNGIEGAVFTDGTTAIWEPKAYFTGQWSAGELVNEYSTYVDDPGKPRKLKANPQDGILIQFADISWIQAKLLNRIFSCDTLYLNDMEIQNEENLEPEDFEKSDLKNYSLNVTITDNDGFVKNS